MDNRVEGLWITRSKQSGGTEGRDLGIPNLKFSLFFFFFLEMYRSATLIVRLIHSLYVRTQGCCFQTVVGLEFGRLFNFSVAHGVDEIPLFLNRTVLGLDFRFGNQTQ